MTLPIDTIEGKAIVRLRGRLDAVTSPLIEAELSTAASLHPKAILLDFSELSYLSSAGLRVLITLKKNLNAKGGDVLLFCVQPSVMEIFTIVGFDRVFHIVNSEAEALKYPL